MVGGPKSIFQLLENDARHTLRQRELERKQKEKEVSRQIEENKVNQEEESFADWSK